MTASVTPAPRTYVSWTHTLWIALFIGLLVGVSEVAVASFRMFVLGRFIWLSRDVIWMAPLAAATFLLLPGVLLAVLAATWRKLALGWAVGLLAFAGIFSQLLAIPRIAIYASAIVAAGIAVRIGASARRSPNKWPHIARRGTIILASAFAMLGVGARLWRYWSERRAVAAIGPAAADAPNVLLIILDTVRRSSLSLYGYNRPTTPHLTELATESAVFDFAVSTAPWTLPSHATLFTGHYPDSTTGDWRTPLDNSYPTLAGALREHGYVTGGFVDNLLYTSYESRLNRGFMHYADYPITIPVIARHVTIGRSAFVTQLMNARSLYDVKQAITHFNLHLAREGADEPPKASRRSDEFLAWERARKGRPFFAFINYFEAHGLFRPTPAEERLFPGGKRQDYYDAAIRRLDGEIDRVLDSLRSRGVLDNTIVVIAADHGEHLGDHNLEGHANSLYLSLLRVPLIIRFPRRVPVRTILTPITLRDLPASILELAGVSSGSGIPGSSLTRFWTPAADTVGSPIYASLSQGINVSARFRNARGALASVLDGEHHYIRGPGDEEELFDYRTDSLEQHNLTQSSDAQGALRHLRALLAEVSRGFQGGASAAAGSTRP